MSAYPPGSEPRRLPERHVARGKLLSVLCMDGFAVANFAWGAVSLPVELEPKLRELLGLDVACFRFDGEFHLREGL